MPASQSLGIVTMTTVLQVRGIPPTRDGAVLLAVET